MSINSTLKFAAIALALGATVPAAALNIVVTNDDGCEASTVHALYQRLRAAGHQVIISASMTDQSGQGGALAFLWPITPLTAPSRGGNLPAGTAGVATLAGVPTIDYGARVFCVNSTPVAATLHALDVAATAVFGAPADLVISGPNYGNNTGLINNGSGTVNAALIAVNRGFAAIAVSAATPASYRAFNALSPSSLEYEHADLVVSLVDKLVRNSHQGDRGLMPAGHAMNVNFPRYELGQSGSLRWRMADEGTAAVAAPFFVMDLSTSSTAQSVGLGNMRLPGVSVNIVGREDPAAAGLRFVTDADPSSEQNVVAGGEIAVSVIRGNHQAPAQVKALVRSRLHGLVR